MANQYRDRIISSLTEKDVGTELRVCGWIENIRDHGGVSFIDLRDMYGTLQVVMRDTSLLDGLVKEECISIEGKIEHRDEETYNPRSLQVRSSLRLTRSMFWARSTASFLSRS